MDDVISEVWTEIHRADAKYGPPSSTHESYGVLAEEMIELLAAIHENAAESVRTEAIQIAAVALRLARACRDNEPFADRSGFRDRT